jgi:TatD DNase family protein
LQEAALLVPDGQILVETDAPFLTPHPYRGRRTPHGFWPSCAACPTVRWLRYWAAMPAECMESARRSRCSAPSCPLSGGRKVASSISFRDMSVVNGPPVGVSMGEGDTERRSRT